VQCPEFRPKEKCKNISSENINKEKLGKKKKEPSRNSGIGKSVDTFFYKILASSSLLGCMAP
jgi:hypothetical protein